MHDIIRIVNDHHDQARMNAAKAKRKQMREEAERVAKEAKTVALVFAGVSSAAFGFLLGKGFWIQGFMCASFCLFWLWVRENL